MVGGGTGGWRRNTGLKTRHYKGEEKVAGQKPPTYNDKEECRREGKGRSMGTVIG